MSAHAAPASTITLQNLLALGAQHKPWAFVPLARQALPQTGSDPELWFLLASNLANLALGTLAAKELDALCLKRPQAQQLAHVVRLRERIRALPDDRVPTEQLLANAQGALDALQGKGFDLSAQFHQWASGLTDVEVFRAHDGNMVRRLGPALLHLGDQVEAAAQIGRQHIAKAASSSAPLTIEGVDPPWLLIELAHRTPPLDSGYQPGIRVVQSDASEFFDGCALADLSEILRHERTECFVGPEAAKRFAEALARDAGSPIAGPYMPLRSLRSPLIPGVSDLFRRELESQEAAHRDHLNRLHARDAKRDESWWRSRIAMALSGQGEPLRVMITTCRFTTVLYSMCQDLAHSLRALGCQVEVLVEPGPHRQLSPLACSRLIDTFDPDVILVPNYTRRDLERVFTGEDAPSESRVLPAGMPFVVWVQDSMPHLLTTAAGASIGPLDLTIGQVTNEMVDQFGYPAESVLPSPLVASTAKFDASRIDPALRDRYACDVAMITHHSETPETLLARLLDELSGSPATRRLAESMVPALDEISQTSHLAPGHHARVRQLFAQHPALDPETREILIQNFAMRYIDRRLRHEAAHWCAQICTRRGWSLRIFGKNWDKHPTLGQFASPAIPHDDALAAAYNAAGVTLHISAFGSFHQRLVECALSGGVPIIRRTRDADVIAHRFAVRRIIRDLSPCPAPDNEPDEPGTLCFEHFASADTHRLLKLSRRLGMPTRAVAYVPDPALNPPPIKVAPSMLEADAHWLLGDLDETGFECPASLEAIIERARTYPSWRQSLSRGIAQRAMQCFTHDALAKSLLTKLSQRAG